MPILKSKNISSDIQKVEGREDISNGKQYEEMTRNNVASKKRGDSINELKIWGGEP